MTHHIPITSLTVSEITSALDIKPFQARQIFRWIHGKQVFDFGRMTNLSKDLRESLKSRCVLPQIHLAELATSPRTGTKKALFLIGDGERVESVLLRNGDRATLCLSTQVGCALACAFCATGLSGFTRNLNAGEIVEQALYLIQDEPFGERTPNVVYMGMGEPFRNYDETVRSIRLLMESEGLGIGARKITVSTAGEISGIKRFAEEGWQVRLSISLHAANDALRSRLVPLNKRYPLAQLVAAVKDYIAATGRQVTFEWVLLDGVNDSVRDAQELAGLIAGLKASVNAIPFNPVQGFPFAPSSVKKAGEFVQALGEHGVKATLRRERGQDIDAACGQLRSRREKQGV